MCVCLGIHVCVAGPTSSMGVNFISQEASTTLYCGGEFPRDIECSVCYRYCSGCSWQRCHGGHFCARTQGSCSLVGDLAPSHTVQSCRFAARAGTNQVGLHSSHGCWAPAGLGLCWGGSHPRSGICEPSLSAGHLREINVFWHALVL